MVNFGFSAFLKLVSMNEKPQRTALRKRVGPSTGGGYDFHKSLRRLARRHLLDGVSLTELLGIAEAITKPAERSSALAALERLGEWRADNPGKIVALQPVTFESPDHLFTVKFEADFGLQNSGSTTAIHIWNTKLPKLAVGPTYAALTMAAQAFESYDNPPDDIGVLSMREPAQLYCLSDVPDQSVLATSIVEQIEDKIRSSTPPPPPPEPHPPSP